MQTIQKRMIRLRPSGRAILLGRMLHRQIGACHYALKDPSTQVGACIVNGDKRIVAIGYNGFPRGISDDNFPWSRKAKRIPWIQISLRLPRRNEHDMNKNSRESERLRHLRYSFSLQRVCQNDHPKRNQTCLVCI